METPDVHTIFKPLLDEFDIIIKRNPTSDAAEYRKIVSACLDLYSKTLPMDRDEMTSKEDLYNLMGRYAACMRQINSEIQSDYKSKVPLIMIFDLINSAIILRV